MYFTFHKRLLFRASFLALSVVTAHAVPVIDQSQLNQSGENNMNYLGKWAQTFTVGSTGQFTGADILAYGLGVDPDLTVTLQGVTLTGRPDDGEVFGSSTLSGSGLIDPNPARPSPYFWHFDFSALNLFVNAGDRLSLVLTSTDVPWVTGDVAVVRFRNNVSSGSAYAGGEVYSMSNTNNGDPCNWCNAGGETLDMAFRTWVDVDAQSSPQPAAVPEPGSLSLLAMGAILLGRTALRRRIRPQR